MATKRPRRQVVGVASRRGAPRVRRTRPAFWTGGAQDSFDGREYRLDSETFAGAITRGVQRTDLVDQTGPPRPDFADRMLEEPLFGNRYLLGRLLETRPDG